MITFKEQYNLPAYLMLPLLKLDVNSFGKDNLINVYAVANRGVVVTVKDKRAVPFEYYNVPEYEIDYDESDHTVILYTVPEVFEEDFNHMMNGTYSKMQMLTKEIIKKKSTLAYKKPTTKTGKMVYDAAIKRMVPEYNTSTNIILKALDLEEDSRLYESEENREFSLRYQMEERLGSKLPKNAELLSKLSDEEIFVK